MDIVPTTDYDGIRRLALAAGLEDGSFENVIRSYGIYEGEELRASVALKRVSDVFSVEWLAVCEGMRHRGIGRRLVTRVADDAKSLGARDLWALARAPEFFLRIGFRLCSEEESPGPTYSGCAECPQYRSSCHPRIVVLRL
jgi:N-acetylglutamate synthase-like GNAT family acetyltransferase